MAGKPGFVLGFTEPGRGLDRSSSLASTYQQPRRQGVPERQQIVHATNAVNSNYMLCVARDADDDPGGSRQPLPLLHVVVPLHDDEGNPGPGHLHRAKLEKIG